MSGWAALAKGIKTAGTMALDYNKYKISRDDQRHFFKTNIDWQKQLAKSGLSMRVADAVKSGLHPLVGAGVNPAQGSPVYASGGDHQMDWGKHGMDLSRAINMGLTKEEKLLKIEAVKSAKIDNAIKQRTLDGMNQQNPPPLKGIPIETMSGGESRVNYTPQQITASDSMGMGAGINPSETTDIDWRGRAITRPLNTEAYGDEAPWAVRLKKAGYGFKDVIDGLMMHYGYSGSKQSFINDLWNQKLAKDKRVTDKRMEFRYDVWTADWKLVKRGKNRKLFVRKPKRRSNPYLVKTKKSKHKKFPGWQGK